MTVDKKHSAHVLMFGLDDRTVNELDAALSGLALNLRPKPCRDLDQCLDHLEAAEARVIFCSFENGLNALLAAISGQGHDVPVIAVSRHADVHSWLDAIEAGASDYCAAPFESAHLKWILQSNIDSPLQAA